MGREILMFILFLTFNAEHAYRIVTSPANSSTGRDHLELWCVIPTILSFNLFSWTLARPPMITVEFSLEPVTKRKRLARVAYGF
jgi:hypothetical protein